MVARQQAPRQHNVTAFSRFLTELSTCYTLFSTSDQRCLQHNQFPRWKSVRFSQTHQIKVVTDMRSHTNLPIQLNLVRQQGGTK